MSITKAPTKLKQGFETVFTVLEYHDIPRSGVANFEGVPTFYKCVFDSERDEYSNRYLLTGLDAAAFGAALEKWEIFLRWRKAFDLGETSRETHPALPEDKQRYEETKKIVEQACASARSKSIMAAGQFEVLGNQNLLREVLAPWQVKWSK